MSSTDKSTKNVSELLPAEWLGLDPIYPSCVKLFIKSLKTLQFYNKIPDVLDLYGHPISSVEVVGTVIEIRQYYDKISFFIDDSTDTINCCYWINTTFNRSEVNQNLLANDAVKIGDLVRVRGKIHVFHDIVTEKHHFEITVHSISIEEDPHVEMLHWVDIMNLDRSAYRKPFVLPDNLRKLKNKKVTLLEVIRTFLGFPPPLSLQNLNSNDLAIRSRIPLSARVFSIDSLMADNWVASAVQNHMAALMNPGKLSKQEVAKTIDMMVEQGEVLYDPEAISFQKAMEALEQLKNHAFGTGFELFSQTTSSEFPYVTLSNPIMVPIIMKIFVDDHDRKKRQKSQSLSHGVYTAVIHSQFADCASKVFKKVRVETIHQMLKSMADMGLIYQISDTEFELTF